MKPSTPTRRNVAATTVAAVRNRSRSARVPAGRAVVVVMVILPNDAGQGGVATRGHRPLFAACPELDLIPIRSGLSWPEPRVRIERTTARLQGECSTTELTG